MRKKILTGLLLLLGMYLAARSVISHRGEGYFREVLSSYERAYGGDVRFELERYRGGWSGAEATVRIRVPEYIGGTPFRNPLRLTMRVDYGPLFFPDCSLGLLRIRNEGRFSHWLDETARREFLARVPGDLHYRYLGRLDWFHVMHERIGLGKLEAYDSRERMRWTMGPLRIVSDYLLSTLRGRAEFSTPVVRVTNGNRNERLELIRPRLGFRIDDFSVRGPFYGAMEFSSEKIRAFLKGTRPRDLRFGASGTLALQRRTQALADLSLGMKGRALNAGTRTEWAGLREASLRVEIRGLGIRGLEKLAALRREQERLQREMRLAVGAGNDPAMQKAILALQALDDRWIEIYNSLLIPGTTRLHLEERLLGNRESRLKLDFTFTGRKLRGNPVSAFIALAAHADRLAEGSFDLALERELARKLAPEMAMVLDAMVEKGLANLKEGVYRLKGEYRDGKVIINGTRYDPEELALMILI